MPAGWEFSFYWSAVPHPRVSGTLAGLHTNPNIPVVLAGTDLKLFPHNIIKVYSGQVGSGQRGKVGHKRITIEFNWFDPS